jgi:hypothetical protein
LSLGPVIWEDVDARTRAARYEGVELVVGVVRSDKLGACPEEGEEGGEEGCDPAGESVVGRSDGGGRTNARRTR